MSFRVLLFGPYADALGRSVVEVHGPVDAPCTAGQIMTCLGQQYPALVPFLPQAKLAVNGCYATTQQPLEPRDELAIIGMVSGG